MLPPMKTMLTLNDDVAALLRQVQETRKISRNEVVNEALRRGLQQMLAPSSGQPYRTPSVSLGRCLVESIDDTAVLLASVEGEAFR
jgi:hypothetical protein